ncbi:MAG TPA: dipeptide epimerase [Thermoplasmata archaeon]|jgi:L-alanine-DL-glutamate epimerase-like enolase superfamily enzyme|nr:dipeptide epimerase [Thermoplasmata archaeon]
MRIDLIETLPVTLQRRETFTIARGSSPISEVVFVAVHSGNLVGHGCAAPTEVTMENVHSVQSAFKVFTRAFAALDFDEPRHVVDRMDRTLTGNPSAKAAMDMALHDLAAQAARLPLYAYLGGRRDRMMTDITIGIMGTDAAVDRARRWVGFGFRALKVKVGRDWKDDYKRLKAIREAVDKDVELRVDGNQGYRVADALSFARKAEHLRVSFFEQPVSVDEWEGMRVLAESSPIPIMADEMAITPDDVKKLRWAAAAKCVNLKLMKHGGIVRAADVNAICESAGYPAMVGCMGEPQLSIAAGLHFALAHKNVRWLDLDSYFNIARDPTSGLRFEAGQLVAPNRPGLGIHVDFAAIT